MNRDPNRTERLQDYLDGLLSPAERSEVESLLRESPDWAREHQALRSIHDLLDTSLDVDSPPDLVPGVFAALAAQARRGRGFLGLPARVQNGFVLAAAATLAAIVVGVGQLLPSDPAGWVGRATVAATSAVDAVKASAVGYAASMALLEWIGRLLTTLGNAATTALASSAQPLMGLSLTAIALTALVAYVLLRTERGLREGGIHVSILA